MPQGNIRVENFRRRHSDLSNFEPGTISPGGDANGTTGDYGQFNINTQAIEATLEEASLDVRRRDELAAEISVELAKIDDDEISDRRAFARGYLARAKQRESAGVKESIDIPEPDFEPDPNATGEEQSAGEREVTSAAVEAAHSEDVVFPVFHNAGKTDEGDPTHGEYLGPEEIENVSEAEQGQVTSTDKSDIEEATEQMNQRVDRIQSISATLSTVILLAAIGLSFGFGFGVVTLSNPAMVFAIPVLALIGVALAYIEARAEQRVA